MPNPDGNLAALAQYQAEVDAQDALDRAREEYAETLVSSMDPDLIGRASEHLSDLPWEGLVRLVILCQQLEGVPHAIRAASLNYYDGSVAKAADAMAEEAIK